MESYDPDTAFSSIDRHGRYKYSNQPKLLVESIRLAGCLIPTLMGMRMKKKRSSGNRLGILKRLEFKNQYRNDKRRLVLKKQNRAMSYQEFVDHASEWC